MALDPVPDKAFVKRLRTLDPLLELEWDRALELWCIYYNAPDGNRFKLVEVKNEDGSFRPLDDRTIEFIKRCDWSGRIGTQLEFAKQWLNARQEAIDKQKRKQIEEIQYRAKQLQPKLDRAWENEDRGIYYDFQVKKPKVYVPMIVDYRGRNLTLDKENGNVDIKSNTDSNCGST